MPPIKVSGQGKIEQAEVRVDGVEFEKEPDKITRPAEGDKTTDRGGVGGSDRDDDDNVPSVADINITTDPVDVSSLPNSAVVTVTLSTSTSGASIYYTLDGTTPTKDSELYEGPFAVTAPGQEGGTVTIKAIGVKEGYTDSKVAEKEIKFKAIATIEILSVEPNKDLEPGKECEFTVEVAYEFDERINRAILYVGFNTWVYEDLFAIHDRYEIDKKKGTF